MNSQTRISEMTDMITERTARLIAGLSDSDGALTTNERISVERTVALQLLTGKRDLYRAVSYMNLIAIGQECIDHEVAARDFDRPTRVIIVADVAAAVAALGGELSQARKVNDREYVVQWYRDHPLHPYVVHRAFPSDDGGAYLESGGYHATAEQARADYDGR
jgi:hypothetical protein